jgi:tetratricopeptide (TPR) repeat protein
LRQWSLLEGWLAEDLGLLIALEVIKRAARDWIGNAQSEAWLAHRGERLREAEALDARPDIAAKLDSSDRRYLAECKAREERDRTEAEQRARDREEEQIRRLADAQALAAANKRIARRTGAGMAAAVLLAILAGGLAYFARSQSDVAVEQRKVALEQKNRLENVISTLVGVSHTMNMGSFGTTYQRAEEMEEAKGKFANFLEILTKLSEDKTDVANNLRWLRGIADQHDSIGSILRQQAKFEDAQDSFKKGLNIRHQIENNDLESASTHGDLAASYYNLGEVLKDLKRPSDALENQMSALKYAQSAAKRDDKDEFFQYQIAVINYGIAEDYGDLRNQENSNKYYQFSLEKLKELVLHQPNNREWKRGLAWVYYQAGVLMVESDPKTAREAYFKECVTLWEDLQRSRPTDLIPKNELSWGYAMMADALKKEGNFDEAEKWYSRAHDFRIEVVEADKENGRRQKEVTLSASARWIKDLAFSYGTQGDMAQKHERLDDARNQYVKAIDTIEEAIALVLKEAGDHGQRNLLQFRQLRQQFCSKGLDVARKLAAQDPDSATAQANLIHLLIRSASIAPKPRSLYDEALNIAMRLDAAGRLATNQKREWIDGVRDKLAEVELPQSR